MHDLAFADAAWQSPAKILRLNLRPYSIGHEIILLSQRNALLGDREYFNGLLLQSQRSALIRAVLVCYRTWRQNHLPEKNLRLWSWMNRNTDWSLAIAEFRNYYDTGTSRPPSPAKRDYEIANGLQNEEEGRELGGCFLAKLLHFAARMPYKDLGFETPYDVPMALANHVYLAQMEVDGNVIIENRKEAQVKAEMAQHLIDLKKEKEAEKCQP